MSPTPNRLPSYLSPPSARGLPSSRTRTACRCWRSMSASRSSGSSRRAAEEASVEDRLVVLAVGRRGMDRQDIEVEVRAALGFGGIEAFRQHVAARAGEDQHEGVVVEAGGRRGVLGRAL